MLLQEADSKLQSFHTNTHLSLSLSQALKVVTDSCGFCKRVSRAARASLVLITGRCGLPIAHRTPIAAVMGAPIIVDKVEHPSEEVSTACLFVYSFTASRSRDDKVLCAYSTAHNKHTQTNTHTY